MTSKQRSYLKGLAMTMNPSFQIGKSGLTTEIIDAYKEALEKHELLKINVLKNCEDDINGLAIAISENTNAEVVQIIGRKIVIYKQAYDPENRKIQLPR